MPEVDTRRAAENGDIETLKKACSEPGFNINARISTGRALIHYAADKGQKEVLQFLIDNGANVSEKDRHGITPLLAAIFEDHTSCVALLLAKGADKNEKAPTGDSAYDIAENDEIKKLLE